MEHKDSHGAARETYIESLEPVTLTTHFVSHSAVTLFNQLPASLLPSLPLGFQWIDKTDIEPHYSIVKHDDVPDKKLDLVLYGDEESNIDYSFLIDDVPHQSFTHTSSAREPARKYPMPQRGYVVTDFNYNVGSRSHLKGHCSDHKDTKRVGPRQFYSTYDIRNYIPEPPNSFWGKHMRRVLVAQQRKDDNAYMQLVHYPEDPYITRSGQPVPDYVYFATIKVTEEQEYKPQAIYSIDWDIDYAREKIAGDSMLSLSSRYATDVDTAPIVSLYDPASTDRGLRLQIRNLSKRASSALKEDSKALYKHRDAFFTERACVGLAFENAKHSIATAIEASENEEAAACTSALRHGSLFSRRLLNLDDERVIISDAHHRKLKANFKNEATGFDDDALQDEFRQIYTSQRCPT